MQRFRILTSLRSAAFAALLAASTVFSAAGVAHAAPTSPASPASLASGAGSTPRITVLTTPHALPNRAVSSRLHVVYFRPRRGATNASTNASTKASTAQGSGDLLYNGGPVQHSPNSYLIFWGAGWTNSSGYLTSTGAVPYNYTNDLSGTSFENILTQYYDYSGSINNTHVLAGAAADSSTPPTDSSCGGPTIEDTSIQNEASSVVSQMGWTLNSDSLVFVFTPNGDYVNDGSGACSEQVFCAYHNWSSAYGLAYAAMAYPFGSGCQVPSSPNGDLAGDSLANVTSHEQFEAITDPQPSSGWVDSSGYEIGDKCAWDFSAGYTYLNNGGAFELQTEYSNASSSCVNSY